MSSSLPIIDDFGNLHQPAGAPEAGRFAEKRNSRPARASLRPIPPAPAIDRASLKARVSAMWRMVVPPDGERRVGGQFDVEVRSLPGSEAPVAVQVAPTPANPRGQQLRQIDGKLYERLYGTRNRESGIVVPMPSLRRRTDPDSEFGLRPLPTPQPGEIGWADPTWNPVMPVAADGEPSRQATAGENRPHAQSNDPMQTQVPSGPAALPPAPLPSPATAAAPRHAAPAVPDVPGSAVAAGTAPVPPGNGWADDLIPVPADEHWLQSTAAREAHSVRAETEAEAGQLLQQRMDAYAAVDGEVWQQTTPPVYRSPTIAEAPFPAPISVGVEAAPDTSEAAVDGYYRSDEYPAALERLYDTARRTGTPVTPQSPEPPIQWLVELGLIEEPEWRRGAQLQISPSSQLTVSNWRERMSSFRAQILEQLPDAVEGDIGAFLLVPDYRFDRTAMTRSQQDEWQRYLMFGFQHGLI